MEIKRNSLKKIVFGVIAFIAGLGLMFLLWILVINPILSTTAIGQLTSSTIEADDYKPFFPTLYSTGIGSDLTYESIMEANKNNTTDKLKEDFKFYYFQPVVKEYIERDGLQLMIAEYGDPKTPNVRRNVQILLGGEIDIPERLTDNTELSEQYAKRFVEGVVYLLKEDFEIITKDDFHGVTLNETYSDDQIVSIAQFKELAKPGSQISLMYMGAHTDVSELTDERCEGFEIECALSEVLFDYGFGEIGTFHLGGQVSDDFLLVPYFFTPELIDE